MGFSVPSFAGVEGLINGTASAPAAEPVLTIPDNSISAPSFGPVESTISGTTSAPSFAALDFIGPTMSPPSAEDLEFYSKGVHGTQIQVGTIPSDRLEP